MRVIETGHHQAVERHAVGEADERLLDVLVVAVVVEVLGVDVGDDGDGGREVQERAVGLVGLGDQQVAGAARGVGAERVELAADDDGGIEAGLAQHRGDQRGGGGLAVRAGDGDAVLEPHQLGEHLGARDHGDAALARDHELGVVALHRGREHHHVGVRHVLGAVADVDRGAQRAQARDHVGLAHVGAATPRSRGRSSTSAMPLMPMPPMPTK